MRSIETSGKTVEDAIKTGLRELNMESTDVDIDVLDMGSPGLFGMFGRLAKVRLTVKETDADLDFEMPVLSLNEQTPKRPERKKPESKPRAERPEKKPRTEPAEAVKPAQAAKPVEPAPETKPEAREEAPVTRPEAPAERPPRRQPRSNRAAESRPAPPPATAEDLPVIAVEDMSEAERTAYDFLKELTRLMGVNVEIRTRMTEEALQIQMIGDTLGILIGRRGETLDALQYLTSLKINRGREEYLRVSLDTEHYRLKREEALRKLAGRMASRVRKTGHRVALEPMNPYERRVLHSSLQNNPYVTTHSEGEEPYRRVIITLK